MTKPKKSNQQLRSSRTSLTKRNNRDQIQVDERGQSLPITYSRRIRGYLLNRGDDELDEAANVLIDKASVLLSQQIWCWGKDIESGSGNLLVQFGFQRIETPAGRNESSIYRLELNESARIMLRGFGVFVGDDRWGGLFLHRFSFDPRLTPQADLVRLPWTTRELPPMKKPRLDQSSNCRQLLIALASWISDYEEWLEGQLGISHRQESLVQWNPNNTEVIPAEEMITAWRTLATAFSDETNDFF